jgi:hypothetical protein
VIDTQTYPCHFALPSIFLLPSLLQVGPQIISHFVSSLTNYQRLDYSPSNYQNVLKMLILSKYAYNTSATCHFSIKKIKKINKLKFYFLFLFFIFKKWVFGVALFSNCKPIFPTPLQSPSVCNIVITDFIARLGELQFAIISSLSRPGSSSPRSGKYHPPKRKACDP